MIFNYISLIAAPAALSICFAGSVLPGIKVTDFSKVYHAHVDRIESPKNVSELCKIIMEADRPIALAGGKYSMGGQTWCQDGIVIDMKHLNAITSFDPELKMITVQAGVLWRDIQKFLERHDLSIMVMQSYNDFSVGGSLSVNVHGRDPHGQIIETVEAITVMLADGSLVKASRTERKDLFSAVIGGYGACGVIVDATLHLEDNYAIKRRITRVRVDEFVAFYNGTIAPDPRVALFSANLYGPDFDTLLSCAWYKTERPLTIPDLSRKSYRYTSVMELYMVSLLENLVSEFYIAQHVRFFLDNNITKNREYVVWRSYEMSHTIKSLAIGSTHGTKILQEYFIPVAQFEAFVAALKDIFTQYSVKVLNVSIRHVPKNNESFLSYATQDSFAFVCYIAIDNERAGHDYTQCWTQKMIEAAVALEGTYYLPYHRFALPEQFRKAYPRYPNFMAVKSKYDPLHIFQNTLLQQCQLVH